ncbi:hypothetical protein PVL29_016927 [Vitis rotundifolia]|uniref:Nodulin-like domain-containing protein n=1 Tax=Vitis rotundifolia TaxID=103349 RepID=A0AA39DH53_VITRO|nr:hypothetical protein PVL29_016927 [Vitis rotundifolia]
MVVAGIAAGGGGWADMRSLSLQVITDRWSVVFASFLIMSAAGTTYMFGLYSSTLKSVLGYDQTTLNLLSFFKDLGANVGILPGLLNEITPPWVVLSVGAVLNCFGYFMICLSVTLRIAKPQGTCVSTYASVQIPRLLPTPDHCYYHAFYRNDTKVLVLLIGWLPAAISIAFIRTIRVMKVTRQENELKVFYKFLYSSLGLAGLLMIIIIVEKQLTFSQSEYGGSAAVVILFLFLPFAVSLSETSKLTTITDKLNTETSSSLPPESAASTSSLTEQPSSQKEVSCFSNVFRPPPDKGEDYTILQALFSIDMDFKGRRQLGTDWNFTGVPPEKHEYFLVSTWNYLGSVTAGFGSEIVLDKYKLPRPLILTLILLLSCVGHLLIAFNIKDGLYVASIIIGFCFGAQWPILYGNHF